MIWFYIIIFAISCILLYFAGEWLIDGLMRMAKYLRWKEFVLSFLVIAVAGALPNFFVGIFSAISNIPQLSFGDVIGGNVIDLTLAVALATLFSRGGVTIQSQTVKTTSLFTIVAAILPIVFVMDGELSRLDGLFLILFYFFYISWLFSKKERFSRVYENQEEAPVKGFKEFIGGLKRSVFGIILLLLAAEGIVFSVQSSAEEMGLSIALIGMLVVALGNCLPEIYFACASARKGQTEMILGNLMGSIITPTALVLGVVALICPIEIVDISTFTVARIFLVISALFFFLFLRNDNKFTKKEAGVLILIYLLFLAMELVYQ